MSAGAKPKQINSTNTIFLSLFLILLTFFIMLSAISSAEHSRVQNTLTGIGATFGFDQASIPSLSEEAEKSEKDLSNRLRLILSERGLGRDIYFLNHGGAIVIDLATSVFFNSRSLELKQEGKVLLSRLLAANKSAEVKATSVNITLEEGQNKAPLNLELTLRAYVLALALAELDAEAHVGIETRNRPRIRLIFRGMEH